MKLVTLAAMMLAGCLAAGSAAAACGEDLSAPVAAAWAALDGATGRLGCPTTKAAPAAPSPSGVRALETDFTGGVVIVWPEGTPRAGQAFAIPGCLWRLWFQYGGPTGWLGLPTSDIRNTPDGQRQSFEGGEGWYSRASDTCHAEKGG
ncbi:MAG TPA: hypothetical protein VFC47_07165 [Caulobacteraceae bacterium]|nr:hypothetical protein [Caulobacteraceae bacterium]